MDTEALVDARFTFVYRDVCDGLQIVSLSMMLAPACANCSGFCDQQPCVICGIALCSTCARERPCACSGCGVWNSLPCGPSGLSLCGFTSEHDCADGDQDVNATGSEGEPEKEPVGGTRLWQPWVREPTRCGRSRPWFVSRKNMWVEVACAPQLCPGAKRAANAGFSATMLTTSAYSPKRWRGNFHKAGLSYTTNNARSFAYRAAPCTRRT